MTTFFSSRASLEEHLTLLARCLEQFLIFHIPDRFFLWSPCQSCQVGNQLAHAHFGA